jgi:hypothetical protein
MWRSNYFKVRNFERKIFKFDFLKLQNSNNKSYNTVCFAGIMQIMAE